MAKKKNKMRRNNCKNFKKKLKGTPVLNSV